MNHLTDLLAWNTAYDALTRATGLLDTSTPNLLRYVLIDPRARDTFPDWSTVADEQVSYLHAFRRGDPTATDLAEELSDAAGAAFTSRWQRRPLTGGRTGLHTLTHPDAGPLRLTYEGLEFGDHAYQRLIVYLPADTATAARLDELVGRRPGALRPAT